MHAHEEGGQPQHSHSHLQHSGGGGGYYPPDEGAGQGSGLMGHSSGSFLGPEDRTKNST